MPEMTFEWGLRQNGIDPKKDVNIDTSIAFAAMQGAFIGGTGDYVTLFEPNATEVVKNGYISVTPLQIERTDFSKLETLNNLGGILNGIND